MSRLVFCDIWYVIVSDILSHHCSLTRLICCRHWDITVRKGLMNECVSRRYIFLLKSNPGVRAL